jgi:hypothetical protein
MVLALPVPAASPRGSDGPVQVESAVRSKFDKATLVPLKAAVNETFRTQPASATLASVQDPPWQTPTLEQVSVADEAVPFGIVAVNCQTSADEGDVMVELHPARKIAGIRKEKKRAFMKRL